MYSRKFGPRLRGKLRKFLGTTDYADDPDDPGGMGRGPDNKGEKASRKTKKEQLAAETNCVHFADFSCDCEPANGARSAS